MQIGELNIICLLHSFKQYLLLQKEFGKTSEFSPPNEHSKEGFFYGAYIEKWGMVFWGETNKEEGFLKLFLLWR